MKARIPRTATFSTGNRAAFLSLPVISALSGLDNIINYVNNSSLCATNLYKSTVIIFLRQTVEPLGDYYGFNRVILLFQITQLKIDNNPFAKGFRDTGAGKREKK